MPPEAATASISLQDKYAKEGRVYITGTQALVRLPLLQRQLDRVQGLNTACYISGYRGSPLGGFDRELQRAGSVLAENHIVFQPGVNEDLAATAVWGAQQVGLRDGSEYDGVFGIWYGKGPGVDRSGDAFRHANLAGSAAKGGVLALMGDDHTCESSTTCHQSEFALVDAMMPVLNPAGVQEIIEFGIQGWAMSRYSGCWVGLKCVHDTVSSTVSANISTADFNIQVPDGENLPPGGLNIRTGDTAREQEARLHDHKLKAAQAHCRANGLDRIVLDSPAPRIGIVTTGKSYLDVRQALADLNIDEQRAQALGLRVYKVGMVWPLEPTKALEACGGLDTLLVVEEKRDLLEGQLKQLFYGQPNAPAIIGKFDRDGKPLLRSILDLNSNLVAIALAETILATADDPALKEQLASLKALEAKPGPQAPLTRTPYFCAGCPHSSSTHLPEGSRGMAGIGCHFLAQFMDRNVDGFTQMGGEGASWLGEAPFAATEHVFQQMGDGTYFHSGALAIRAAVAAGVNITFKVLYNDAVAMTGGQAHDGPLTPWSISWQGYGEGVKAIALVTDEPDKYAADVQWAPGTTLHHRRELDWVQTRFRQIPGATLIIYDQTCAAEKRRRRKRNQYPDPAKRLFINSELCEGCGDCGVASNCTALLPKETPLGRKREIDQSACNKDYSCVEGFCPSFVTVLGGGLRKPEAMALPSVAAPDAERPDTAKVPTHQSRALSAAALPEPERPALDAGYNIVITGVGGTGVVTVGALLGMAAQIEGKGFGVLDMTGLAQKGGAVLSHLRLAPCPEDIGAIRIAAGGADLVVGCDSVVTAGAEALHTVRRTATRVVANTREVMPGDFTRNADLAFPADGLMAAINDCAGEGQVETVAASQAAVKHLGDSIGGNLLMLGFAYQRGLIPLSAESINAAIEVNGVSVAMNQRAFLLGRQLAAGLVNVEAEAAAAAKPSIDPNDLEAVVRHRCGLLVNYQNAAYADRYRALVERARQQEATLGMARPALALAVAKNYYKLLAYKDEYEVARLHSSPEFAKQLRETFAGNYRLRFNLAPPLIAKRDKQTGHLLKREFGPWMLKAFRLLARLKGLRGTAFDPFGYAKERRMERRLIADYEQMLAQLLPALSAANYDAAVALAELPEEVRGFGHVKEAGVRRMQERKEHHLAQFHSAERTLKVA